MRWILLTLLMSAPVEAQTCPPVEHDETRLAELMAAIRIAPNEMTAREISRDLWEIWANAPDARAQALLDRGMRKRAEYNFEAANEAFNELVTYCPDYAEGYNQRAFVQFLRQDFAGALEDLEHALELSPDHIAAKAGLALTLMGLGRTEVAQSILRDALELNPWLPERSLLIEPRGEEL
ncbi:tetratricopeptide repeat protein [Pseudohalocynthiibacter aestuariivivens]|jgi:tetratricopeptide (TPR) repeat protein|uniref:Tetratricopeptide repeat protein n=1 Tax=Pseudohalocynthiibacter aestuariivivens TaxID=1591409 RepID=A0ABV5JBZ3_9RHOB|nr:MULTISPECIES: tetratricopeptide repeat protein [Pseudohalocynthiibacter]MBS9718359.1 tetratricopeptide repeat protein [Pseudohalocynthiibacter aestuariivivens]MCK0103367.1 tetratricopeptide repeat protein [Pseudohalocynthiibacter sp. F2068]